jgi:predicted Ser/Thr protein kinase
MLAFTEDRYLSDPYTFEELVDSSLYVKFDVLEQKRDYGRVVDQSTLDWWKQQSKEARAALMPSENDISIVDLYGTIVSYHNATSIKKQFTRGNTFDPMILQYLLEQTGKSMPWHWGTVRDTRSMIDGMSFGMKLDNKYIPNELKDKFIGHDPRHDIAMDVMRMQYLAQAILGE